MARKNKQGFTLIEIIVTIGIISFLLVVSVANYRAGQQDDILRFAAARLANTLTTAQTDAIGGRIPAGKTIPPSAYGVRLTTNSAPTLAQGRIFADNVTINSKYDSGEEVSTQSLDPNESSPRIIVQSIEVIPTFGASSTQQASIDIAFASPSGVVKFDGAETNNEVVITLQHTGTLKTKKVTINRLTGRIDAQY